MVIVQRRECTDGPRYKAETHTSYRLHDGSRRTEDTAYIPHHTVSLPVKREYVDSSLLTVIAREIAKKAFSGKVDVLPVSPRRENL